jgi:transcriptional regulator with XRE-family HTH domain
VRYKLGGKLRAARERAVLSQSELAERSGLSEQTIRQLELNHQRALPRTLRKLAAALNVQSLDLVDLTEDEA